jgi:hypothetical protein
MMVIMFNAKGNEDTGARVRQYAPANVNGKHHGYTDGRARLYKQ